MNVMFVEQSHVAVENPSDIVLGNKTIGKIEPRVAASGKVRYMAVINVCAWSPNYGSGAIYGHGDSPTESIHDAFSSGKKSAQEFMEALDLLRGAVYGE